MFITPRALLSHVLLSMTAFLLIAGTAEAKHKKKSGRKVHASSKSTFETSLSVSVNGKVTTHFDRSEWFNGKKMGLAGGQSLSHLSNVGFFIDWTCKPYSNEVAKQTKIPAIAMIWGLALTSHDNDKSRYRDCVAMKCGQYPYVAFLNEFDLVGDSMSGGMSMQHALSAWKEFATKHKACGSKMIGPSCAMGVAEKMCTDFYSKADPRPDAVSVHLFTRNEAATRALIEHYVKFGLPIVVTEMACIDYSAKPAYFCNKGEIAAWFKRTTEIFQEYPSIVGFSPSDANNGKDASFTQRNGDLSFVGQTLKGLFQSINTRSLDRREAGHMEQRRR